MSNRVRQDALLRTLRRGGPATVADLARQLKVSPRTLLRDLRILRDAGYVIHSDVGRGGGLRLDPKSIFATPKITVPEVFALLISVAAMRAAGNLPFASLADEGLAKIENSLPPDKLRDLRRFLECLHIGQLPAQQDLSDMGKMEAAVLPAFEQAFLKGQMLQFAYLDGQGRRSLRKVEPQAMLILSPLWYLVAWDPKRLDFRHFRMDRISQPLALEGSSFRRRHVTFADDVCPYKDKFGSEKQ